MIRAVLIRHGLAIRFLGWLGVVRVRDDGSVHWPVHICRWHVWVFLWHSPGERVGVFRNKSGVVKWLPGRLLPRRRGFHVLGFELGDRG